MSAIRLLRRGATFWRRSQLHSGFSRFGESNCNRLLGIAYPVLPFAHVMDFLADEFSRLRAGRFTFFCVVPGAPDSFLIGHFSSLSDTFPLVEFRHKHCDKPIRKKQ
jgi:hypothetical protein